MDSEATEGREERRGRRGRRRGGKRGRRRGRRTSHHTLFPLPHHPHHFPPSFVPHHPHHPHPLSLHPFSLSHHPLPLTLHHHYSLLSPHHNNISLNPLSLGGCRSAHGPRAVHGRPNPIRALRALLSTGTRVSQNSNFIIIAE